MDRGAKLHAAAHSRQSDGSDKLATIERLCVYCGSGPGEPAHTFAVDQLTDVLVREGITLVYGGARVGLMRHMADAMLRKGGRVEGVMPRALVDIERAHPGLHALHITEDMARRKAKMLELSDACIALPGGIGTLDELFDALTGVYVGTNRRPVGLLNVGGFWDPLLQMLRQQVVSGYLSKAHYDTLLVSEEPDTLLSALRRYRYSDEGKIATEQNLQQRVCNFITGFC